MTALQDQRGALEAIERIVNRGGDPEAVLEQSVGVLRRLYPDAAIVCERRDGAGVAAIDVGTEPPAEDREFLDRVATLVSAYCRPA